jgi:hypothetical protein
VRANGLFKGLKREPIADATHLLHALSVGLAVINLATCLPNGENRASSLLAKGLEVFSTPAKK